MLQACVAKAKANLGSLRGVSGSRLPSSRRTWAGEGLLHSARLSAAAGGPGQTSGS